MEADTPTLSPRQERFCRYVSLGHTLAEAARRAGYSPASCRQRGSELYARKEIQQHVAVLADREAKLEERMRDGYMHELREIRGYCMHYRQYGTALRALTAEIRLSGVKGRWAERRSDDEEEREADLRARLEAELRERIETELRARIEAEVRARMEMERQAEPPAEAVLSGTNHDGFAEPDVPVSTPAPDAFDGADPDLATTEDMEQELHRLMRIMEQAEEVSAAPAGPYSVAADGRGDAPHSLGAYLRASASGRGSGNSIPALRR